MPPKNFYSLKEVQKHMPKYRDEQKDRTGMPLQQHILAVGRTGSGKSQALCNYILESSHPTRGTFDRVILVYKTWEPLYRYLDSSINGDDARPAAASADPKSMAHKKFQTYEGLENMPPITAFPDSSEKNQKQTLVVFDDCVNDRDSRSLKKLLPFYTYGRKKGITNFMLSQSFFATDRFIRRQTSWLLLCGMSGTADLRCILRSIQEPGITVDSMQAMFAYSKRPYPEDPKAPTWLKVCLYECPLEKRFSRGWTEYLNPMDFAPTPPEKAPRGKKKAVKAKKVRDEDDSGSSSSSDSGEGSDADDEYEDWDGHILTRAEILGRQS
jgi:hypothetical protein